MINTYFFLHFRYLSNLHKYTYNLVFIDTKEGVLLTNLSPPVVLFDRFPGGGILELRHRLGKG